MRRRRLIPAIAAVLAVPSLALAHAQLRGADPPVGGTVHPAPSRVEITFSEAVEPRFSRIVVTDAAGAMVAAGDVGIVGDSMHLAVGLKPLGPGTYHVVWHATSVDTHQTQGAFDFTVSP